MAKKLARHPFLAFGLSAAFLSVTLPFIVFMMFTIVTVMMTFTGFVIVEGKMLFIKNNIPKFIDDHFEIFSSQAP